MADGEAAARDGAHFHRHRHGRLTEADVQHVAALARLAVPPEQRPGLAAELGGILAHMAVLRDVDVRGVEPATGVGAGGMPLRADEGPPLTLGRPLSDFAPAMRDGFFLVPRLDTHAHAGATESAGSSANAAAPTTVAEDGA